mmetsp:Transcript_3821/g.5942  ORF Transcript_3821/g.5942 Transcript_3821/m.5942 type:complete len:348 (-) Transcript_3821:154-1197(-)|eukprot:CAMPEP_0185017912 /NCGR_PEP_ID=MMETSP1103-20130426/775_1 /TAXON_ID=36769 /ORGANISM="Paraphysomonas bandaiensis, Strain Caron Lab Isolate" /LENGTH=347 /DNA_ID=CAMNT_0027547523 /DNA_START=101 /DNA_END=1144 /DNA_ORIENTATION=+
MEFITGQGEEIQIVGDHYGEPIALPLPFPDPVIIPGGVQRLRVQDNSGVVADRVCVISSSHVYELGRRIRDAIYGAVHCGCTLERIENSQIYKRTSDLVAVKIISKDRLRQLSGRTQEDPMKEMAALQFVGNSHPNIMGQICCIEDNTHFFSIMRFCNGGEVYEYIDNNGVMSEPQARHLFSQVLDGLEHLQSIGVCHRDMSLENLLLSHDMQCIIIDMGMCLRLPRLAENDKVLLINPQGPCGKKNYISPEVLENKYPFNGLLVDMWAAGVILFILLTGVPPVETASPLDSRFRMIRDGELRNMLLQWNIHISEEAMDLLQRMLAVTPSQRLTIDAIRRHPWMTAA